MKNPFVESESATLSSIEKDLIRAQVTDVIKTCYDPEIPVNIYELGLIYGIDVDDHGNVVVRMTLTTPHCPAAQSLPGEVKERVSQVPGVRELRVEIVWDPPWNPTMMSESAKLELGMM
jgi:FeS assembly SUF system protein